MALETMFRISMAESPSLEAFLAPIDFTNVSLIQTLLFVVVSKWKKKKKKKTSEWRSEVADLTEEREREKLKSNRAKESFCVVI